MEAHHGAFKDIIILVKMAKKSQIHSLVKLLNCISLLINRRRYRVVMRSEWHIPHCSTWDPGGGVGSRSKEWRWVD